MILNNIDKYDAFRNSIEIKKYGKISLVRPRGLKNIKHVEIPK